MIDKRGSGIHYEYYAFTRMEWLRYILEAVAVQGVIAYVFYQSIIAMILLTPLAFFYVKSKRAQLIEKRKILLQHQFKDAILAVSSGLQAGYSIENAFQEALVDMRLLYGKEGLICHEFTYLIRQINNNITLETLLLNLASRSQVEDIKDFAEIFQIAKRKGGNLGEIIKTTAATISQKNEIKGEIRTLLGAKQYEQKIMNVVPFFIILYIGLSSPGFFDPLYHNILGIFIMSVCLLLYVIAYTLANKIVNISL